MRELVGYEARLHKMKFNELLAEAQRVDAKIFPDIIRPILIARILEAQDIDDEILKNPPRFTDLVYVAHMKGKTLYYIIHRTSCRHATGHGIHHDVLRIPSLKIKLAVGIARGCGHCKPDLSELKNAAS